MMWDALHKKLTAGDQRALARAISLVENEAEGYEHFMEQLHPDRSVPVIGITGPPGAGKSTLTDKLIHLLLAADKNLAVLCVDPSSPFHFGALLGDRIRLSNWYNHPRVFIRSLASRGSLGGLHPSIIEITDLLRVAPFDYIIVETVGVGQSEVEIAGLADVTVVVVVPEGGDEIQTMKAGLMEIADLFVVNKGDRPDADQFVKNLRLMLAPAFSRKQKEIPVIKTTAITDTGITELYEAIRDQATQEQNPERASWLLAEKAFQLIQKKRMKDIRKEMLKEKIAAQIGSGHFQLYTFIKNFYNGSPAQ